MRKTDLRNNQFLFRQLLFGSGTSLGSAKQYTGTRGGKQGSLQKLRGRQSCAENVPTLLRSSYGVSGAVLKRPDALDRFRLHQKMAWAVDFEAFCPVCACDTAKDEAHFVFDCPAYCSIRDRFSAIF